jgi:hypothetical protein
VAAGLAMPSFARPSSVANGHDGNGRGSAPTTAAWRVLSKIITQKVPLGSTLTQVVLAASALSHSLPRHK